MFRSNRREAKNLKLNIYNMGTILYIIAVVLIIGWVLGFFVYSVGALIHILLVIAVIAVLLAIIRGSA